MKHPHYLFGTHAVLAALANPMRKIKRVMATSKTLPLEGGGKGGGDWLAKAMIVDSKKLENILPPGSVHQGIAVECEPLRQPSLQEWLSDDYHPHPDLPPSRGKGILLLDQVTDPHNIGAILRSAAAFDIGAIVVTDRNAPGETGVMAKAASGGLEVVPMITVTNLAQSIQILKKAGYWVYGLDGEAKQNIHEMKFDAKTALIMGAEGKGLRRLTAELCDALVKLPMSSKMESLNVSNAAAIAMYELYKIR